MVPEAAETCQPAVSKRCRNSVWQLFEALLPALEAQQWYLKLLGRVLSIGLLKRVSQEFRSFLKHCFQHWKAVESVSGSSLKRPCLKLPGLVSSI